MDSLFRSLQCTPVVISLRTRSDRHAHVEKAAQECGLGKIDMLLVDKHSVSGAQGCFESHVQLAKMQVQKNIPHQLVLEDDFAGTDELLKTAKGLKSLRAAITFVQHRKDWDLFYLGVLPNVWTEFTERQNEYVYRMTPYACTHAYIISLEYAKEVATWTWNRTNKDAIDWRYRSCKKAFVCHPQIFKQAESPSDINHFTIPVPLFARDFPLNLASWYGLNVGHPLLALTFYIGCFCILTCIYRMQNGKEKEFALKFIQALK